MIRHALLSLTLLHALCQGFDLTFNAESPGNLTTTSVCAMLQCRERLEDGPDQLSRKITAMTIHRRGPGDGQHWKQIATVTRANPQDHRVSDGRHIAGDLVEQEAKITVGLIKTDDCVDTQFSCVVVLEDGNSRPTVIKSFVGGSSYHDIESNTEYKYAVMSGESKPPSEAAGHSTAVREVKDMMTSLREKLQCIENRLDISDKNDNRVLDKIEDLKTTITDKIHNLDGIMHSQIMSIDNRIEDRMDRMGKRLEDKLSQVNIRKPEKRVSEAPESELISQLGLILDTVELTNSNIGEIKDKVKTAASCPSSTPVVAAGDTLVNLVSGVASLTNITNGLASKVDTLRPVCTNGDPAPVEEFFDVLGTGKKEWRLVFRGTAYNNVKIYPAYVHGTGIPVDVGAGCKQFNHSLPCVNHYRNRDAMENWANIDEVLLAVVDKGQVVKHVLFNGHGSTPTSWFEENRVILSSWDDLKTQTHNIFSIEGETRPRYLRRFYINHDYTTCETFRGWFFSGEAQDDGCPMEKTIARPFFQYAAGNTMAVWQSSDVARADSFGIFVKYT